MMGDNQRYEILEPRGVAEASGGDDPSSIGAGAYGVVYKARDRLSGRLVALKKIRVPDTERDIGISSSTLREITLLRQLEHPNVVRLENVVMDRARINLVFELADLDLKKLMDSTLGLLSPELVQSYAAQMFAGIEYCHSMGVMHRDLKPHNILVTLDHRVKIADFGLARTFSAFNRPLTIEVITRWYRAPEVLLGNSKYGCSVDVWSIGCIIAELSNKVPLLTGNCDADQLHKIFQVLGTPHAEDWDEVEDLPFYRTNFPQWEPKRLELFLPRLPEEAIDLIRRTFAYNPKLRITAKEALRHPYVRPFFEVKSPAERKGRDGAVNICTPPIRSALTLKDMEAVQPSKTVHKVTPESEEDLQAVELGAPKPHPNAIPRYDILGAFEEEDEAEAQANEAPELDRLRRRPARVTAESRSASSQPAVPLVAEVPKRASRARNAAASVAPLAVETADEQSQPQAAQDWAPAKKIKLSDDSASALAPGLAKRVTRSTARK